ncbi:MAG TPA: DNRLRE domain-containing protein [Cytophagaceae bacterium]|jgi:hypothetical protein|nr:DNRLRE domain-containing protein [Cytophagaceae bacterium]
MKQLIKNMCLFIVLSSFLIISCRKKESPLPTETSGSNGTSTPVSVILKPNASVGKDVFIRQNSYGANTSNYASYPNLVVDAWTNGNTQLTRSLLDFDLTSIPSGASISKVMLVLYADTTNLLYGGETKADIGHNSLSGPNNWLLERITSSWTKSTVTWDTQPTTDASTAINLAASISSSQTYEIDVTQFIKDEIANPTLYYGFMLKLSNENPYRSIVFCSSRHQYSALYPELQVTYTK